MTGRGWMLLLGVCMALSVAIPAAMGIAAAFERAAIWLPR